MKKNTPPIAKVFLMTCIAVLSSAVVNEMSAATCAFTIATQPLSTSVCAGSNGTFTVVTGGAPCGPITYQWQYFNGATWNNVANGSPVGFSYAGNTTATLTISGTTVGAYQYRCQMFCSGGGGCSTSATQTTSTVTLTVVTVPASVTVSGSGTVCGSTTITATGGAGGTIYFQGTTSGGTSTATLSSSQVISSSGTYYFRSYNPTVPGCWGTQGSATVSIMPTAAPPALTVKATDISNTWINQFTNNVTICQFQTVTFTVPPTSPAYGETIENKTFKWKINSTVVNTQTGTSPSSISYMNNTLTNGDTVTLTIKWNAPPSATCYTPDSITSAPTIFSVTANQPPVVFISHTLPTDTICRGNQVLFTASAFEAGTPTYQWYMNGSPIIGATASTYTTPATLLAGNYIFYCSIVSGDACDSQDPVFTANATSASITIVINPCLYYIPTTGVLGTFNTCGAPFYDSQNDLSVLYNNSVDGRTTFCPAVSGQYVSINFTQMRLAAFDSLRIYNSTTTAGDVTTYPSYLASFGSNVAVNSTGCLSSVVSSAASGCLTAWFKSNAAGQDSGWRASITCSPTPSPGPLPGTNCANPTVITALPYTVTSHTTQCYFADYTAQLGICNSSYGGEDHVYQYTATGPECTSITLSGTTGNPTLAVYSGCPGSVTTTCLTPIPQTGNSTAQVTFPSAGTYYIIVDEAGLATNFSNYNLSIQSFGMANVNDLPCNAQYIDLLVSVNGNTTCSGSASEPGVPWCWTGGNINATWHYFIAPASGSVRIRTTSGTINSTQIALYELTGICSTGTNFNLLACNTIGPACNAPNPLITSSEIAYSGLTPGASYYVRVDGINNNTGNYSIMVVDQTSAQQPYVAGQDCVVPLPVCSSTFSVPSPGFVGTGWVCDFTVNNNSCLTSGELNSCWLVFTTNGTGPLSWKLTPYGINPPSTDYDWVLMDISSFDMSPGWTQDSRVAAACAQINTNNLPWVRCNLTGAAASYNTCCTALYCTGMCPSAPSFSSPPSGASYNTSVTVNPNETYLLFLMNHWQNNIGFIIDFNAFGASPIAYQSPPAVVFWTGTVSTDWFLPANWGNCGPPDCNTSAIIYSGAANYPAIQNAQVATCNGLDIKAGATVTLNGTATLEMCGNFVSNGSLIAATTATINVKGSGIQYFDGNMIGGSSFPNLTMSKTLNSMTLLDNLQVAGNLKLANSGIGGRIITGLQELYVTNNAPGAILPNYGSLTSFVQGNLRRNLSGAPGAYYFPIGTAVKGWQLAKVDFTASHTIPNILAYFSQWSPMPAASSLADVACNWNYNYSPAYLDNGYWTLTASANSSSATYNMILYNLNVTNSVGAGSGFTIMKGANTGSLGLNGICDGTSTAGQTKRSGMTGFSVFASAQTNVSLPITLINFEAVPLGTEVKTTWITASEINNDYFVIERTRDGATFEEVGRRSGAGNSTTTLYYTMYDLKPFKGTSYYRLRQVDFDGQESTSELVAVTFLEDGILNVFPNPAESEIKYRFNSAVDGVVTFELIDVLGKIFVSQQVHVNKGLNTSEPFDISFLPQGVYFVQLKPEGSAVIEPMQKHFVKQTQQE